MDLELKGKTAIVTGGAKGIGSGISGQLAAEGANVVINVHSNDAESQRFCQALLEAYPSRIEVIQADVGEEGQVKSLFGQTVNRFGGVDILVNNAGVTDAFAIDEMELGQWEKVLKVNLTGMFLMCREMVRHCKTENRPGAIVNILSKAGVSSTTPKRSAYNASKAGGIGFTKALACEVTQYGIRVNGVLPGFVRNSRTDALWISEPEQMENRRLRLPTKAFGEPEDIGVMVAMLASPKSKLAIGSIVDMTGGLLL